MNKNIKAILILVPFIALFGFTGYRVYQATKQTAQANGAPGRPGGGGMGRGGPGGGGAGGGSRMQQVTTGVVTSGKINERISLTGNLKAKQMVDVTSRISGRITQVLVDTGLPVARGALIAVVEDDEIKQQIERSKASISVADASIGQREAELVNAKMELNRKKQLVEQGILSKQELDALDMRLGVSQSQLELAKAQKRQSEAELRELNIRQGQTRIYAPISGIVARRLVDIGAMVGATNPIVTIVSVSPMVIETQVAERDITRIRRGATVSVTVDSLANQTFTGKVMRIAPMLDPQTRNGMVEIEIPNRESMLKAEMFARIELDLGSSRETLLLPRDALVYRGNQPGVYTIDNNVARFKPVDTGLMQEQNVELLSGLKEGDKVVTLGANLIKDGDQVRVGGRPGAAGGPAGPGNRGRENAAGGQGQAPGAGGRPQGNSQPPRRGQS
ncbi:MAG: efflux RND transporter periplasmic adaptor subunit [Acidobacteria bacterium]|nr:efflux RND transporter periplasmic adaptor subunit [Acidobacteriota bacterium]